MSKLTHYSIFIIFFNIQYFSNENWYRTNRDSTAPHRYESPGTARLFNDNDTRVNKIKAENKRKHIKWRNKSGHEKPMPALKHRKRNKKRPVGVKRARDGAQSRGPPIEPVPRERPPWRLYLSCCVARTSSCERTKAGEARV